MLIVKADVSLENCAIDSTPSNRELEAQMTSKTAKLQTLDVEFGVH